MGAVKYKSSSDIILSDNDGTHILRRFKDNRTGSVSMMTGLLFVAVVGAAGFATDYARAVNAKHELQRKLDGALISAARKDPELRVGSAENIFSVNTTDWYDVEVSIDAPTNERLTGEAMVEVPSYFGGIIGIDTLYADAKSEVGITARTSPPITGGGNNKACIILESTDALEALRVNSGADITAPDCEIHVNSEHSRAANFNAGIAMDVAKICIQGSGITSNNETVDNVETNCNAISSPFKNALPEQNPTSCDYSNLNHSGGSIRLSPGVYCGWHNFKNNVNVTFQPGTYILKDGGWNVDGGNWAGDGITFYFHDTSKIQFNSAVQATLTPPTEGDLAGVIFYEKEGLANSEFVLNDSRDFDISGLIYLPSRDTIYNSGSQLRSRGMTMVLNTLILNSTVWNLNSGPLAVDTYSGEVAQAGKSSTESITTYSAYVIE